MLLYNVTIGIDADIEQEWLQWMKDTHLPRARNSGSFTDVRLYKVAHDNEDGTISYSVQHFARSIGDVTSYIENYAPRLIQDLRESFANKHIVFQTLLEEVQVD